MSDGDGQHGRTTVEPGRSSDVERRTAPLRSASLGGLAVGGLLLVVAAAWLQHVQDSQDGSLWGPVVCLVFAVGTVGWAGLSALAFWVCRAVLGE